MRAAEDPSQFFSSYTKGKHQGIRGLTPAQMANIPINLMGNRWETMIGLADTK